MDTNHNDILRTILGLSPIVAAAAYTWRDKTGVPVANPVVNTNPVHQLGLKIGRTANDLSINNRAKQARAAEAVKSTLQSKLQDTDSIKELLAHSEKRRGLVQALTLTMDDPALNIEDSARLRIKQQLLDIAHSDVPDQEKLITDVMRTIADTASDDTQVRFSQLRSQFTEVGAQLKSFTSPVPRSGVSLVQVPHAGLSQQERRYVDEIQGALGKNFRVDVASYQEYGKEFRQARIYRTTTMGDRYKASIPLDNLPYYRAGENARTQYRMPRGMLDLANTANLLEKKAAGSKILNSVISMPEFFTRELVRRAGQGSVDFTEFRSWQASFMTNVERVAGADQTFGAHARLQSAHKMNVIGLYNIERLSPQQQTATVARLGTLNIFDPGVGNKRLLSRGDYGIAGVMGMHKGSMFSRLQSLYGWEENGQNVIDRTIVPLTLREHQLIGRTAAFTSPARTIPGSFVGSMLSAMENLPLSKAKEIHPFGDLLSGGLSSVYLMDVKKGGRLTMGAGSKGMAYTGTEQSIRSPVQFTVLDPKTHGYLGSSLLEEITQAGEKGVFLTAERLKQGLYVGETGAESKILPWDERTTGMWLKLAEVSEDSIGSGSKRSVSLAGYTEKRMDIFKIFSLLHKGNVEVIDDVLSVFDRTQADLAQNVLGALGLDTKATIAAPSDMLSKGPIGFIHQIGTGTRLVSAGGISLADIKKRAAAISASPNQVIDIFRQAGQTMETNYKPLANYAQAAMELMVAHKIDAKHIGIVMAGVFHGAEGSSKKFGLNQNSIMTMAEQLFGKGSEAYKNFSSAVNTGITIGQDIAALGESVGDWGRGRAGVEPRFAKTLHERLLGFGLDINTASDVVAGVYRNKIGLSPHFEMAAQLLDMATYIHGGTTGLNYLSRMSKQRMSLQELVSGIMSDDEHSLANLLKKTSGGIVVDASGSPAHISEAFKEVFGSTELFLPGKEAFKAAQGTVIKQAEGAAIGVESQLGQVMKSLQERIVGFTKDTKQVRDSLSDWKDKSDRLFVGVIDQLHAGKIKGAISPIAGLYDLVEGTNFGSNKRMLERARNVFFHSSGQAVFQTGEGFLSQLADLKQTLPNEELSWKARQFFTSMESESASRWVGLAGVGGRHPMLSTGNVFLTQTFRHLKEVSDVGGEDITFQRIKNTPAGQRILKKAFGDVELSSFREVARRPKHEQMRFFDKLVRNISSFTSGTNADAMFFPSLETSHGDLGIGVQAFLDMDGDHSIHFLFDKPTGQRITNQLKNHQNQLTLADFKGRAFANSMVGETKQALDALRTKLLGGSGSMSVDQKVWHDVMKEVGISMSTGQLDTALRPLHEAFLMYESDSAQKQYARTMLASMQEIFVIKGKKLPIATDYPEQISKAVKHLTQSGDVGHLRSLMYEIFGEQDIAKSGMVVSGKLSLPASADSGLRRQFDQAFQGMGGEAAFQERYHLEDFLSRAEAHARRAVSEGTNKGLSAGQLSSLLQNAPSEALQMLKGSTSMNAGALEGFFGKNLAAKTSFAVDQMKRGIAAIDANVTKNFALGLGAAALVTSLLRENELPAPLMMPGEMGISNNSSIIPNDDITISPEAMGTVPSNYDEVPPINSGRTYINKQNAYQVRSEVTSSRGITSIMSYFNNLTNGSGRGIVTINDQRRPITPNYVDRLLGE